MLLHGKQGDPENGISMAVAAVVSGWKEHFAGCGVTAQDIEYYAAQIDRPFPRQQREEAGR